MVCSKSSRCPSVKGYVISHARHLIRSWRIRHEKRFDVDDGVSALCQKTFSLVLSRCRSLPLSLTSGVLGLWVLARRARMGDHGQTATARGLTLRDLLSPALTR